MRLLAIPVVILGVLVGCDDTGTLKWTEDTGIFDTGSTTTDPLSPPPDTQGMGTQVGSEGFWGCPIEKAEPIDGGIPREDLGGSPEVLTAALVGEWPLQISDLLLGLTVDGSLTLTDEREYYWLDVAEGTGCVDHAVSVVSGAVVRQGSSHSLEGLLGISANGNRLVVSADSAGMISTWGAPIFTSVPNDVSFRIDAGLDPFSFDGTASYVDCDRLDLDCPTAQALADVDGSR